MPLQRHHKGVKKTLGLPILKTQQAPWKADEGSHLVSRRDVGNCVVQGYAGLHRATQGYHFKSPYDRQQRRFHRAKDLSLAYGEGGVRKRL